MNNYKVIIDEIALINRSTGAPELTLPVYGLLDEKHKSIHVAVLGQFKSGKSSLINSMVGENILPVGVVPLTAIITRLQYGSTPGVIIHFTNGSQIKVSLDDLPLYVTEKQNPGNFRKVAVAIVEHPSLAGFQNVSIVDTPGLGSFYRHNSDTTLQWLPYTGVALISISAERPLSDDDITLLKGITRYCPTVALVITKTDLFTENEITEIKAHISTSVKEALGRDIPIFEYSIYQNTQDYRKRLTDQFIEPLNLDFENNLERIIRFKINAIIGQSIQYAELTLQAALKREQEKDTIANVLKELSENRHYHEREILLSGSSFKGEVRDKLEALILPFQKQVQGRIAEMFAKDFSLWHGNLYKISRNYEQWMKQNLGAEILALNNQCFESINQIVKEPVDYYEYSALRFRQRIADKLLQMFGVDLVAPFWQIDFTGIDSPDVSIYRAFDSHIDTLLFFLPSKLFKELFYSHFQRQIPREVEKNLQRYISDLTEKIIKAIDNIHKQSLLFIHNEFAEVEQVLLNDKTNIHDIKRCIEKLHSFKSLSDTTWLERNCSSNT